MKTFSFLDNLVARNMPETAVIQPRPVSLFEPWPGQALPFPAAVMGEAEAAVVRATPSPLPGPEAQPLSRTPNASDTAVPPPTTSPTTTPRTPVNPASTPAPTPPPAVGNRATSYHLPTTVAPGATQPVLPIQPAHKPAPQLPVAEPLRQAQPAQRRLPSDDASAMSKPTQPPQSAPTPFASNQKVPASRDHQIEPQPAKEARTPVIIREQVTLLKSVDKPQIVPTLVEIIREQPVLPLASPAIPPPATVAHEQPGKPATSPVVLRPDQIKPFSPAADRPVNHQLPATTPEPAPTVQITIGRIEVRATPPAPTKVQEKQTRTPVLNLDEYLRQRNGGRS